MVRNNSPVTNGICSRAFHQDSILEIPGLIIAVNDLIVDVHIP